MPRSAARATSYEERRLVHLTHIPISLLVEILLWLEHSPEASRLRRDVMRPGVALQGLCALRLQEATRLTWGRVTQDTITVEGEVKNEHSLRRLPIPRLVAQILAARRELQGDPSDDDPVLRVPGWKAYASRFPHLLRVFKQSAGRNLPERFKPSDLRNTLPSEASQRKWDDTLVQIFMGQTWGQSVKDRHHVALVAADEIGPEKPDPMVEKLREKIIAPLDDLIEKAKAVARRSTIGVGEISQLK